MSGGAGLYTITNNQVGDVSFSNADNNIVNLLPASSGVYSITASTWTHLVALLGATHVVAVVTNPTYKYTSLSFTPVASPTDVYVIQGSATKTVNITKIKVVSIGVATTTGNVPFTVVRRSTAGTIGSAVLTAVVPSLVDTTVAAATAVLSTVGTANYGALGTQNPTGGILDVGRSSSLLSAAAGGDGQAVKLVYGETGGQPLKLRGATDFICINLGGTTIPGTGGLIDIVVETYEDNS